MFHNNYSQARWSLLHRLRRLWQAATGTHKSRCRCCLLLLKYFLLVINLIARYGFCGDCANFLDGAHKFFSASLFGAHSRANLFPNRDLFAVGEHQNAILFPNWHNVVTGEHHRATAFPNRHQITQRAQNRKILCPFSY